MTRRIRVDGMTRAQIRRRGVDRVVVVGRPPRRRRPPPPSRAAPTARPRRRRRRRPPPRSPPVERRSRRAAGDRRRRPAVRHAGDRADRRRTRPRRRRARHARARGGPGPGRTRAGPRPRRHHHVMTTHHRHRRRPPAEAHGHPHAHPRRRAGPPGPAAPDAAADRVERFLRGLRPSALALQARLGALRAERRPARDRPRLGPAARRDPRRARRGRRPPDGLVDPTVLDDLEAAGYRESWDPARRLDLRDALAAAPGPRRARAARPRRAAGARSRVDDARRDDHAARPACASTRAAPARATPPSSPARCSPATTPGPWTAAATCASAATPASCATSRSSTPSPARRSHGSRSATAPSRPPACARASGAATTARVRHHLLDPSTGPAGFTGLVAVTALAPTAVEAEALAKAALLRGPDGARARPRPPRRRDGRRGRRRRAHRPPGARARPPSRLRLDPTGGRHDRPRTPSTTAGGSPPARPASSSLLAVTVSVIIGLMMANGLPGARAPDQRHLSRSTRRRPSPASSRSPSTG